MTQLSRNMKIYFDILLSKFKDIDNCEYKGGLYKTKVPKVSKNYLNVIFLPLDNDSKEYAVSQLTMPDYLLKFYSKYNGASLFFENIEIYGFHKKNQLIDYYYLRLVEPGNILDLNLYNKKELASKELFVFGNYWYYRSLVCCEIQSGKITCFEKDELKRVRATWPSFEEWLASEITRVSDFFDEYGNPLLNYKPPTPCFEDILPKQL